MGLQGIVNAQSLEYAKEIKIRKPQEAAAIFQEYAANGNPEAQHLLGLLYLQRRVQIDDFRTVGLKLIESAANQVYLPAICSLGAAYYDSYFTSRSMDDINKAIFWLQKASALDDPSSKFYLGEIFFNGTGREINVEEALKYWDYPEQSSSRIQYMLGCKYLDKNTEIDDEKAYSWFKSAAEQGNTDAAWYITVMYQLGRYIKDYTEAYNVYLQYANIKLESYSESQKKYATMVDLAIGKRVDAAYMKSLSEKIKLNRDDAESILSLARLYMDRSKAMYDIGEAKSLLSRAMELDHRDSYAEYARLMGKEFPKELSTDTILALLEKSVQKDSTIGMNYLGSYLIEKTGKTEEGIGYLEKAANRENTDAMFKLGMIYENEETCIRLGKFPKVESAIWYGLASKIDTENDDYVSSFYQTYNKLTTYQKKLVVDEVKRKEESISMQKLY